MALNRTAVALVVGLALAGGAANPVCARAAEPVTLYYWGNEGDVLALDLIQDFESLHDGSDGRPPIKIIMGQSASVNKTSDPQRLLCGIAGGDPPDVVWFDRFAVGEWAAKGAFMSLQPYLDRDLAERPDDPFTLRAEQFYTPCWDEACYGDEVYAIPTTTDNRAMFYNLDSFERHAEELIAAGCVDPDDATKPGPPQTWDQLKAATEILTEYDDDGKLVRVGFIPNYGNSWLYIYGWLNGGKFMSDDGRTCLLDSDEIVDALVFMTEVYDIMGGAAAVNAFQTSQEGGDLDPFLSDKVAMRIDGDGYLWHIANYRRDMQFGVCLAPAPPQGRRLGWCGGWALVIPAGAEHPDEAWEFIKYMVSRRAERIKSDANLQNQRAQGYTWIPGIHARKDLTEWILDKYFYSDPTVAENLKVAKRTFVDAMPFSKYRPVTPVGQKLWNEQVRAMENGIYKKFDKTDIRANAREACRRAAAEVQRELDAIFDPREYPQLSWKPIVVTYIGILLMAVAFGYWYFNRKMHATGYFRREFYAGYLFASPWFLGFAVFGGGPIVFSLFMSFCRYDVLSAPEFVAFDNYIEMLFGDPLFYKSLWNTVFMVIGLPLGMAVGLGIAMLLSYEIKGMAVYRTFFYLPAIMPAVAASILWIWIFNPQEGILNSLLDTLGLTGPLTALFRVDELAWLQNEYLSKPALILMGLWGAGGSMIIWLAGLKGIPKHLYEAAELDGAGRFRKFWNVTLPMLSPYILLNLIMGLIGTFQIFTQAYIMTQGGPVDSTLFYAYALFNNAFRYMKMGYASAMAWVLFAIVLVLTIIQLQLSKRWVYYETEK
ncbi:MAG: extracellular solute-binding protein [Candidatus Hydrogenedentes bacterium]|nr:extracellular solute-binding protein [Candidatus Hydrogenedentota bacterium]